MHVLAFFLRQSLESASGLALWRCFLSTPCLAIRPGFQCLGLCGDGSLSPACKLDAGGLLGQGRCSAHDRRSPSFVRIYFCAFDRVCVSVHGRASKPERVCVFMEHR